MIRGFSASYAGHVVDDNLGLQGTPANDRWYTNDQLAEALNWAVDIAQHLDNLGYEEFWMAEHHFQPEGYECIPNLVMMGLTSPLRPGASSLAAGSTSPPCGTPSAWPKTSPWPTSSPTAA